VTQLHTHSADSEGAEPAGQLVTHAPEGQGPAGPIERVMSTVIRKLAWSRLSDPKVAVTVSGVGLLLGMLVGAMAPNTETLPIRLPLSHLLPSLGNDNAIAIAMLYTGDILACLGLAGMLWAHSQGWRPDPRRLLLASAGVVAVVVSLTPVGSSDVASYAAYGRIASLGGNPYTTSPLAWLGPHSAYTQVVGTVWQKQSSVYGPIATLLQWFAAWIGGTNPATTIWILMILNGAVFIGVGYVLLKTSDDPVRATLFWVANPVIIQQLVGGGQLDTFVAALAICAIQVARRYQNVWGDVLVGLLIGLAFAVKVNAALIGVGLAWPLLRRHEWTRAARMAVVALVTVAIEYSFYGLNALKSTFDGLKWVIMPSPWRLFQMLGEALGVSSGTMTTIINCLWPIAMFVVAWIIYRRISSDQPREVVAPFALTFAWVLVAPWVFAWYTALAWATLALVPRNRMTRWLTIVTVVLALWLSNGGHSTLVR
jgi:Glycosyltransferase family 87